MRHLKIFESFENNFFENVDTVWDVISHLENQFTVEYTISNLITGEQFTYQDLNRKVPLKQASFIITLTPDKKTTTKDFAKELESISQMCINLSDNIEFDAISIFNLDSLRYKKLPIVVSSKFENDIAQVGTIVLNYHS